MILIALTESVLPKPTVEATASVENLRADLISETAVEVSWTLNATLQHCIEFIEITNGASIATVSKESSSYTFVNLPQCEQFFATVRIATSQGAFGPAEEIAIKVMNVSVDYRSWFEAQINWDFVPEAVNCVKNVTVIGARLERTVKPDEFVVIPELKMCHSELIEVQAYLRNGRTVRQVVELDNRRHVMSNITLQLDRIYWTFPTDGLECVEKFRIVQVIPLKDTSTEDYFFPNKENLTTELSYPLLDPMEKCAKRIISVTPIYESGFGGVPSVQSFKMATIAPIEIEETIVDNKPGRKVVLKWQKPALHGECVKEYRISYPNESVTLAPNENSATFDRLDACRTYLFTIELIDVEGEIRSQVIESVTIREEPMGRVRRLELYESDSGEVWVRWELPDEWAYCVGSYHLQVVYDVDALRQEYNVTFIPEARATSVQLNVTDLCSLTSLSITPISRTGSSGITSSLSLTDLVHGLETNQLSSDSVAIEWASLPFVSKCVAYYLIFREGLPEPIANTTSNVTVINKLKPCKNYTIRVVAVGQNRTMHSPAEVTFFVEAHISEVQKVTAANGWIQWKRPISGADCIAHYLIAQTETESGILLSNTTVDVEYINFTVGHYAKSLDFCPLLRYTTRITPVSFSGALGDPHDNTRPPPIPGPVREVNIDASEFGQLTVSWLAPELFPSCVSTYRVSYLNINASVPPNETQITITGLDACVKYDITITPVNFINLDAESVTVNATVKEEQMSGVMDLELYEVEPRSMSAKWKPPENGSFCLASYRIVAWIELEDSKPEQFSNSTTELYVSLGEVIACAKYSVQVIPVSITAKDGINEIADIVTKERVIMRYHIEPARLKNMTAHSLELQTGLTSDNNNMCSLMLIRFTCRSDHVPPGENTKVIIGESAIDDPNATFSGLVTPLEPFSEYNCTASILNIAGWSEETIPVAFLTDEDFPEQPRNLRLVGGDCAVNLSWDAPLVKNGCITRYRIHIRSVGAGYPTPSYCVPDGLLNETIDLHADEDGVRYANWNEDELRYTIKNLRPYVDYVVQIAAATRVGLGLYTEMVSVTTLPAASEPVFEFTEFNVTLPVVDEPYNSSVFISWSLPCRLNGRLRGFMGQFIGFRDGLEHTLDWSRTIAPGESTAEKYTFVEHRLEPEFRYNVSVMVFVDNVSNHSEPKFLSFDSPAGIPELKEDVNWGTVNVLDAPNPTRTARISLSDIIFNSSSGSIKHVALLLSERHCQEDPTPKRNLSIGWPDLPSWLDVAPLRCTAQYQTTPKQWNPVSGSQPVLVQNQTRTPMAVDYVIGNESCQDGSEYCNGPLKPGTEYALIVRIFTNSGFSDSALQFFQTDSLIQLTLIVSTILVCLLVAFFLGIVVLWRSHKLIVSTQMVVRSPNDEPSDIPLKSFSGIYEELIQSNREKITKEYQAINYFSEQLVNETVTFFVAKENEKKNRYLGILPYDGNRVPLDFDDLVGDEDEEVNDYINASFIDGYKYQREYIATQGPKKETSFDFWRMILQYDVESIVMLTQTVENDKIKCYQYFPRFNQQVNFRDVSVRCTQELNLTFYQKRLMIVTRGKVSRAVFHYHFLVWPDHGCPASPTDLIKFIKIIRSERKNLALPVVVHCSAGVGRTGTFIALDIILQRIQQEKKINIYDTVKQLRRQRVKMVQTAEQYDFLYQSCLEYTNRNNRKKPKISTDEISTGSSQSNRNKVPNGGERRPRIKIKFPKYINSGIANVKSYAPDDVESNT
ncbi:tyrosine-protein phosphatase 10D isoform X2 [Topomyia yanbarensis]|uniref:tyrosine-protein phosphatase 10D isoform X2 n=1 Tax=Topomyia yanbarensis TaxID=2498891 RepID=UPI00273C426E|nr:tyrosine-protein phosphatase 10D isoform X2 [Topomyia yanbarensis]